MLSESLQFSSNLMSISMCISASGVALKKGLVSFENSKQTAREKNMQCAECMLLPDSVKEGSSTPMLLQHVQSLIILHYPFYGFLLRFTLHIDSAPKFMPMRVNVLHYADGTSCAPTDAGRPVTWSFGLLRNACRSCPQLAVDRRKPTKHK